MDIRYNILSAKLGGVLDTIVSPQLLTHLSEKQIVYLDYISGLVDKYRELTKETDKDLWSEDIDECLDSINNILNQAKSKIKPKQYSEATNQWLKIKMSQLK